MKENRIIGRLTVKGEMESNDDDGHNELDQSVSYRCAICMDTQEGRLIQLKCTHCYHKECITACFTSNSMNKGNCPYCGDTIDLVYPLVYYVNEFFLVLSYCALLLLIITPFVISFICIGHIASPIFHVNRFNGMVFACGMCLAALIHTVITFIVGDVSFMLTWLIHGGLKMDYLTAFIDFGKLSRSFTFFGCLYGGGGGETSTMSNETTISFNILLNEMEPIYSFLYVAVPLVKMATYFINRFKRTIRPQLNGITSVD
jgi:ribosomal protein S27E